MTNRDTIVKELNELGSSLAAASSSTLYQVPGGYFEALAAQVMNRIKAMESLDAADEQDPLPSLLSNTGKTMPYQVPAGYFDGLEEKLMQGVLQQESGETAAEELENLSPLLSGLKKQAPYSVPAGYFDTLAFPTGNKQQVPAAKVIALTSRKWFRYAAAAMVIGLIALGSFLFLNKETINPATKSYAWVKKSMKDVPTEALDSFITITEKEAPIVASNTIPAPNEVKELVKNISDKELQDFLNDVEAGESDSDEDIILN